MPEWTGPPSEAYCRVSHILNASNYLPPTATGNEVKVMSIYNPRGCSCKQIPQFMGLNQKICG